MDAQDLAHFIESGAALALVGSNFDHARSIALANGLTTLAEGLGVTESSALTALHALQTSPTAASVVLPSRASAIREMNGLRDRLTLLDEQSLAARGARVTSQRAEKTADLMGSNVKALQFASKEVDKSALRTGVDWMRRKSATLSWGTTTLKASVSGAAVAFSALDFSTTFGALSAAGAVAGALYSGAQFALKVGAPVFRAAANSLSRTNATRLYAGLGESIRPDNTLLSERPRNWPTRPGPRGTKLAPSSGRSGSAKPRGRTP
ncbi:MAG: hypothetical protein IPP68_03765 [Elusimicrobia bacterium]|nr:hypothetical protein [Elusimicrobiota bacterium]